MEGASFWTRQAGPKGPALRLNGSSLSNYWRMLVPPLIATSLPFPGRTLKEGQENPPESVLVVQRHLNAMGCGPVPEDGHFDRSTTLAVKRFQMRFTDADGAPLKVDGKVGPVTWAAMFGSHDETPSIAGTIGTGALAAARQELGVLEQPPGSNRGPEVDGYLRAVGLNPAAGSFAWCQAFVYFCFGKAATAAGRSNPVVKTAGVLAHWNRAASQGGRKILNADASANPALVVPGQIFIIDHGGGTGHTGLVAGLRGGKLVTIEGNTNDGGSRDGVGVFERHGRTIASINRGFIEYA